MTSRFEQSWLGCALLSRWSVELSKWCVVLPATLNHQTALSHRHGSQPTANRLPLPQRSGGLYLSPGGVAHNSFGTADITNKIHTHACSPVGTTWRRWYGLAYWEMEDGQYAIIPPPSCVAPFLMKNSLVRTPFPATQATLFVYILSNNWMSKLGILHFSSN